MDKDLIITSILCVFIFILGLIIGVVYYNNKPQIPVIIEKEIIPNEYLGEFEITFYTHTGNRTSTGVYPQINRTIATDPKVIPYGTIIFVEGYGAFIAEDTGAVIKNNRLDIFVATKAEAIQKGRVKAKVYKITRR